MKKHQQQSLKDKDMLLAQKEEELTYLMKEYYQFDMEGLSDQLKNLVSEQLVKLNQSHIQKLNNIDKKFTEVKTISQKHIQVGSQYTNIQKPEGENENMIDIFDKQSQQYQEMIGDANQKK